MRSVLNYMHVQPKILYIDRPRHGRHVRAMCGTKVPPGYKIASLCSYYYGKFTAVSEKFTDCYPCVSQEVLDAYSVPCLCSLCRVVLARAARCRDTATLRVYREPTQVLVCLFHTRLLQAAYVVCYRDRYHLERRHYPNEKNHRVSLPCQAGIASMRCW